MGEFIVAISDPGRPGVLTEFRRIHAGKVDNSDCTGVPVGAILGIYLLVARIRKRRISSVSLQDQSERFLPCQIADQH